MWPDLGQYYINCSYRHTYQQLPVEVMGGTAIRILPWS